MPQQRYISGPEAFKLMHKNVSERTFYRRLQLNEIPNKVIGVYPNKYAIPLYEEGNLVSYIKKQIRDADDIKKWYTKKLEEVYKSG